MSTKPRQKQNILATDDDRALFKKKCKDALAGIEEEYGVSFSFGRIDQVWGILPTARMKCTFFKEKKLTSEPVHDNIVVENEY